MSFILILSITIRLVALAWSIGLLRQLRDWRMGFLSGMLVLMVLRQTLTLLKGRGASWEIIFSWHIEEFPGILLSILAFLAVFYLKNILNEHDQALAERYKSERRLANIVDIAADAIITIDQNQHILQFNQGAEKIFGYQAEEVLGQPIDLLLPSHFVKVHQQHIRTATAAKSIRRMGEISQKIVGLRKDGSEFPADASISRLSMDDEITFTVILRDITDRVRAGEALRMSEKHLRNVLDGLGPHMLVGLMTPNGLLIEANLPALEIAGLKPKDVMRKPFEETYWWAYSEPVKQQLRDAIRRTAKGETCRYDVVVRVGEKRFITIDFCLQPLFDAAGNVIYLISSAVDITDRKLAEDHIQHLLSVLEAIRNVDQLIVHEKNRQKMLQGACDIISQTRQYKFVWIGMLEEGSKDVLPIAQAGFGSDYLKSIKITWDDSETGKGPTGMAIKTRMPSLMRDIAGDSRYKPWREQALKYGYASSASLSLLHENRVFGTINVYSTTPNAFDTEEVELLTEVSQDIGFALHNLELEEKHKQAEKALAKAHEQLEMKVALRTQELAQANIRLQELDQLKSMFIASMSHELRTPLNSIIGFSTIIQQGMAGKVTQEQQKQLAIVKRSASHLLNLVNDIIDVSKIEAGKVELAIEQFNLPSLVLEVKETFALAAEEDGIALSLVTPDNLVIESDKRRTQQILVNFLSNAMKFTDQGSIEVKVAKKEDMVEVSVTDTGIGIRDKDLSYLLKAFNRIRTEGRIREGSGLGLYLSRKIATLLGGEISIESEFGKGSIFTFTLPLQWRPT